MSIFERLQSLEKQIERKDNSEIQIKVKVVNDDFDPQERLASLKPGDILHYILAGGRADIYRG